MTFIDSKNWSSFDKIQARKESVIDVYRKFTNNHSLPIDKQYWSMCGRCATEDGMLIENCEYDQITKAGLILPEQWHGVEKRSYADHNLKLTEGKWYKGDFITAYLKNSQNVGIINYDHHKSSKKSLKNFDYIISNTPDDVFIIVNIVKRCGLYRNDLESIVKDFMRFEGRFKLHESAYTYNGTCSRGTEMITFYFYGERK